jgi:hypothetical protein
MLPLLPLLLPRLRLRLRLQLCSCWGGHFCSRLPADMAGLEDDGTGRPRVAVTSLRGRWRRRLPPLLHGTAAAPDARASRNLRALLRAHELRQARHLSAHPAHVQLWRVPHQRLERPCFCALTALLICRIYSPLLAANLCTSCCSTWLGFVFVPLCGFALQ